MTDVGRIVTGVVVLLALAIAAAVAVWGRFGPEAVPAILGLGSGLFSVASSIRLRSKAKDGFEEHDEP
jgi:hypothetical protein